jgi:hypothetical protein
MNVNELPLSTRTSTCLRAAGIETVAQLMVTDRSQLRATGNFGSKSEAEIAWVLVDLLAGRLAGELEKLDAMGYGATADSRAALLRKARDFDRISAIVTVSNYPSEASRLPLSRPDTEAGTQPAT